MIRIKHRFFNNEKNKNIKNNKNIKILILGTFNPEDIVENDENNEKVEIYYGRKRNYLWDLLPQVFNQPALKDKPLDKKLEFLESFKIGFADIIEEIQVEPKQEKNYSDNYIDGKITKWTNIEKIFNEFPSITKVYFTRKTFNGIPNIKKQIDEIQSICSLRNITFDCLPTPARFINEKKLNDWKKIIINDNR